MAAIIPQRGESERAGGTDKFCHSSERAAAAEERKYIEKSARWRRGGEKGPYSATPLLKGNPVFSDEFLSVNAFKVRK